MKRLLSIALALIIVLALCACGESSEDLVTPPLTTDKPAATEDTSNTKPSNSSETIEPTNVIDDAEPAQSESTANTVQSVDYVLENEIIVDNEYCIFTITDFEEDPIWGLTINVYCENKTSDTQLMFSIDDVSVNGYMIDPFWATSVTAGNKKNSEITFSNDAFVTAGIINADEIEFTLRVYNYDDWSVEDYVNEIYTIFPTGLSAGQISIPTRPTNANEYVVVDSSDVLFIILEAHADDIWGYTLTCYLENRTDLNLMFSWDDVAVNGYMIDPFWARSVMGGKRSICEISFFNSDLEDNGISEISQIEFALRVYDYDDWFTDDLVNSTFTYEP